jgi:hypothetical protein
VSTHGRAGDRLPELFPVLHQEVVDPTRDLDELSLLLVRLENASFNE